MMLSWKAGRKSWGTHLNPDLFDFSLVPFDHATAQGAQFMVSLLCQARSIDYPRFLQNPAKYCHLHVTKEGTEALKS